MMVHFTAGSGFGTGQFALKNALLGWVFHF